MPISTALFSRQNPFLFLKIPHRLITAQARPNIKPLHVLFTEPVGHSQKTTTSDTDEGQTESETATELKNNLKQLEQEIKTLREKTEGIPKRMSLFAAFTNKQRPTKPKEPVVVKELSPDMKMFAQYLFEKGYFKDANFSQWKKNFDLDWFTNFFAVGYIQFCRPKIRQR